MRSHQHHIESGGARRRIRTLWLCAFAIAAGLTLISRLKPASGAPFAAGDPWTSGDLIQPQELAAQLLGPADSKPRVVCVGFKFLYESRHVPGSLFYGPGREAARVQSLQTEAKEWSHDKEVVIYCGCCPLKQCPNVRPAFAALKAMGFTRLRLLDLEADFQTDWKGPIEKSLPAEPK